jgi:hypothetical protein
MIVVSDSDVFDVIATHGGNYFGPKDAFDVVDDAVTYPTNTLDAAVTLHDSGGNVLFPETT